MEGRLKRTLWLWLGLMTALLSGCLFRSPDDLYRLPEQSAGYERLNAAIRDVRSSLDAEYGASSEPAVIVSGDNTATIQLQDLDGDGQRESAVTAFRVPGIEKSMKIYIFRQAGEDYQVFSVVEGDGSAIYSIDYVDLNGQGEKELVVNWQLSTGVYQLGAYTMDDLDLRPLPRTAAPQAASAAPVADRSALLATELLLTGCSGAADGSSGYRLLDIDQDTRTEIAVVRIDSAGVGSHVEVFGWDDGAFVSLGITKLSSGAVSLIRMRSNYLSGPSFRPALYIICALTDGSRTIDVLARQGRHLVNLALDGKEDGVSQNMLQGYTEVSLTDINADSVLELPSPWRLPSYSETSTSNFWLINWSQYHEDGTCRPVLTTYHNVVDSRSEERRVGKECS